MECQRKEITEGSAGLFWYKMSFLSYTSDAACTVCARYSSGFKPISFGHARSRLSHRQHELNAASWWVTDPSGRSHMSPYIPPMGVLCHHFTADLGERRASATLSSSGGLEINNRSPRPLIPHSTLRCLVLCEAL